MYRHLASALSSLTKHARLTALPQQCLSSSSRLHLQSHTTRYHSSTSSSIRVYDSRRKRQRLFLAGVNPFLPPSVKGAISPSFVEVPLPNWLESLGVQTDNGDDTGDGVEITKIAAGHAHFMVAYRLGGGESIFAIGRNESGQLGIGYNSQVSCDAPIHEVAC